LSFLADLIHFDTVNEQNTGREKECQKFIYKAFLDLGCDTELYSVNDVAGAAGHRDYLNDRDGPERPNVTAVIAGAENTKPLMLAAHTDTMPPGDMSSWKTDPYTMTEKDGKIFGLGVSDDKCGIASSYVVAKLFMDLGLKPGQPLCFTAYADEEYFGSNGALLACLKYPAELYINLDGGDFNIMSTALGGTGYKVTLNTDFATDTAEPIVDALYFIRRALSPFSECRKNELDKNEFYTGTEIARSAYRLMEFNCGQFGVNLDHGNLHFVIYTDKNEDVIQGELDAIWNSNIGPYLKIHNIKAGGFQKVMRFGHYVPQKPDNPYLDLFRSLAEQRIGKKVQVLGATLSDLSMFMKYGSLYSFNFGLFKDFKIEGGAHQPNEYIERKELIAMTETLALYAANWSGVLE
jgi:acetylornithine deacetylase/succinyl-diaminopimelate desuccinylase-like protein